MGSASKTFALFLTLIVAMSCLTLLVVKPASAQSIPTPAVPQFTLQLVGPPVRVNTTYSLDTNTGQIVAKIGYTNEYSAVNITIKNQVFSNLGYNTVYYNVRIKLENSNDWSNVYNANEPVFPQQSDSEYTILSIGLVGSQTTLAVIPVGAEVDIQVQAMIGTLGPLNGVIQSWYSQFDGNTGPWSITQTVNVPANVPLSPTPTPSSSTSPLTPTETPTSTAASSSLISFLLLTSTIVIAILLAVIIVLLLLMRKRKTA
jgi:hypothetical protein